MFSNADWPLDVSRLLATQRLDAAWYPRSRITSFRCAQGENVHENMRMEGAPRTDEDGQWTMCLKKVTGITQSGVFSASYTSVKRFNPSME